MDISLIIKVAGVGILSMVLTEISALFTTVKTMFQLY